MNRTLRYNYIMATLHHIQKYLSQILEIHVKVHAIKDLEDYMGEYLFYWISNKLQNIYYKMLLKLSY